MSPSKNDPFSSRKWLDIERAHELGAFQNVSQTARDQIDHSCSRDSPSVGLSVKKKLAL